MTATLVPPPVATPAPPPPTPSSAAPRAAGPSILGPTVASGVAVLLSALALAPLFDGGGWVGASLLVVLAVTAAGGIATRLRAPLFLVPVVQAFVLFAVLIARFTDDEAPWDFIPTPGSLTALRAVFADGLTAIDAYAPPVPVTEGISGVVALGVGCVALTVFVLQVSLRVPTAAGIPLVALYVVPSFVLPDGSPWWGFVLVVVGWLVLLVADERLNLVAWGRMLRRQDAGSPSSALAGVSSAAMRLGAAAVVISLALPILVPGLADAVIGRVTGAATGTGTGDGAAGDEEPDTVSINPFISLRRDLLRNSGATVLRYRTSTDTRGYVRLVVNEAFDGDTWKPNEFSPNTSVPASDGSLAPIDRDPAIKVTSVRYDFTSDRLVQEYLPSPENLTEVRSEGDWFIDNGTRTVFGTDGLRVAKGAQWSAFGDEVQPTAEQLDAAPDIPSQQQQDLLAGTTIPPRVAEQARQLVSGTTTKHEAAVAIQDWFRNNFTYSTNVISETDRLQTSSYLEQFLEDKVGYCEQFAATMALMSRAVGIPARVVVGFTQGAKNAQGEYVVSAKDAHAWPELFFTGIGWVRFEPTPRGAADGGAITPPSWAAPAPADGPSRRDTTRPGVPNNRQVPTEDAGSPNATAEVPGSTGPVDTADLWRKRGIGVLLLVGLVALLVPAALRVLRRRRRLAASSSVEDAWTELRDSARDLGVPWSDAHTPRQAAAAVIRRQSLQGEAADATTRLARATEQVRYAPHPPAAGDVAHDVATVRGALWHRAQWKARVRAVLLPVSLRRTAP